MSQQYIYIYISLFVNIVLLALVFYYRSRMINIYRRFKESFGRLSEGITRLRERYVPGNTGKESARGDSDKKEFNDPGELINSILTRLNRLERDYLSFETLLDYIPCGVMIIDRNRRILKVNERLLDLFYLDRDRITTKKTIFVFNNSRLENLISKAYLELKPLRENVVFYRDEDLYIDVEIIPISLKDEPGKITIKGNTAYSRKSFDDNKINLLVIVNNITGEMEFSKLRSQFVANVSHEMRTPLASIRGYLETLADTGAMDDRAKAKSYLDKSLDEVEKLNFLIKDVLDLSKIEYRRNVLFKNKTNLVDIIKSSMDFLDFIARKNNIEINFKYGRDPVYLNTDEELFQQMVRNLVENAIFHAGNGSRLDINLLEEKDKIVLEFKDNGIGISREDQPFIFQRFYRGKKSPVSKTMGSGLGLAIVKHTVELHGGEIKAESTPGKGTCFHITFPKKHMEDA